MFRWGDDDLLTLPELEALLWDFVEEFYNRRRHRGTGRVPAEHWEEAMTARVLRTGPARTILTEALLELLPERENVQRLPTGLFIDGVAYTGYPLDDVHHGARLIVRGDPSRPGVQHVYTPLPKGGAKYLGPVEFYDDGHPLPERWEFEQRKKAWRLERRGGPRAPPRRAQRPAAPGGAAGRR